MHVEYHQRLLLQPTYRDQVLQSTRRRLNQLQFVFDISLFNLRWQRMFVLPEL